MQNLISRKLLIANWKSSSFKPVNLIMISQITKSQTIPHYVSVIVDGGNSFREKANLESELRINMLCSLIKHMKS